jgi:hydroxypyruvate reductase
VVAPSSVSVEPTLETIAAGHPVPTAASEAAGRRALQIAARAGADDRLVVLLSGGASALLAVPAEGITLEEKQRTTEVLLRAGTSIHELNAVRKHLSALKGGQLAAASSAPVYTLAISDVVDDDLSVIGSGPTIPDRSTFSDALAIVERSGGVQAFPEAVVGRMSTGAAGGFAETPKPGDVRLALGHARVIGGRQDAMNGAAREARRRGYRVLVAEAPVIGEARHAAIIWTQAFEGVLMTDGPTCIVSSGETTVHVTGSGRGGRNQEFTLALASALTSIGRPVACASVNTDGVDGPTDAAGAIADSTTVERAHRLGLQPVLFLENNDAYSFFAAIGDLVMTGPTGTNVGDIQIVVAA